MNYPYQNYDIDSKPSGSEDYAGLFLRGEKERIARITEEVKKDLHKYWEKEYKNSDIFPSQIEAIHPEVVDFLLSFELVFIYDDIAKEAELDERERDEMPYSVWEAVEEKRVEEAGRILQTRTGMDSKKYETVKGLLEEKVLAKVRTFLGKPFVKKIHAEKEKEEIIRLSLSEAMKEYPDIGGQNLTMNPLKLRYSQKLVRPSIRNWIVDFRDNMGVGKHSPIDRGNYLFHGENGKKLTPIERQKVSTILRSLDEGTQLLIDPIKKAVIFSGQASDYEEKSNGNSKVDFETKTENGFDESIKKEMQKFDDSIDTKTLIHERLKNKEAKEEAMADKGAGIKYVAESMHFMSDPQRKEEHDMIVAKQAIEDAEGLENLKKSKAYRKAASDAERHAIEDAYIREKIKGSYHEIAKNAKDVKNAHRKN